MTEDQPKELGTEQRSGPHLADFTILVTEGDLVITTGDDVLFLDDAFIKIDQRFVVAADGLDVDAPFFGIAGRKFYPFLRDCL